MACGTGVERVSILVAAGVLGASDGGLAAIGVERVLRGTMADVFLVKV